MSLILDALNRSRRDTESVPGLDSNHYVEDGAATGINWLQWLPVYALAFSVVAIGWLLFDRLPDSAPVSDALAGAAPAMQSGVSRSQPSPAQPEKTRQIASPAVTRSGLVPATSQSAVASAPVAAPVSQPEPARPSADTVVSAANEIRPKPKPAASPRPIAAAPPVPVDPRVAALYQQQAQAPTQAKIVAREPVAGRPVTQQLASSQAQSVSREEEAIDIEQLVQKAREELAKANLSEHEVPFLSDLSQQSKDAIPTLMYVGHDYSGEPARSRVVINGKTLRVGASVGGIKVEEILPDSVVLESRGTRFRLRALNSWVNL